MERSKLGLSLRDRIRNEEIRRQLKSPTFPVELPTFSGSGLGIFTCIQKGCRGQRVLPCTGRRIVGDRQWVQTPYKMVRWRGESRRKPLDASSTGPIVMGSLAGCLFSAVDFVPMKWWLHKIQRRVIALCLYSKFSLKALAHLSLKCKAVLDIKISDYIHRMYLWNVNMNELYMYCFIVGIGDCFCVLI